jgi:hypothetical protein
MLAACRSTTGLRSRRAPGRPPVGRRDCVLVKVKAGGPPCWSLPGVLPLLLPTADGRTRRKSGRVLNLGRDDRHPPTAAPWRTASEAQAQARDSETPADSAAASSSPTFSLSPPPTSGEIPRQALISAAESPLFRYRFCAGWLVASCSRLGAVAQRIFTVLGPWSPPNWLDPGL